MVKKLTNADLLDHMHGIRSELKTEIFAVKIDVKDLKKQLNRIESILEHLRDFHKEDQKRFERIEKHVGLAV